MKKYVSIIFSFLVATSLLSCRDDNEETQAEEYVYEAILNNPSEAVANCFDVDVTINVPGYASETLDVTSAVTTKNEWRYKKVSDEKGTLTLSVTCTVRDADALQDDQLYLVEVNAALGAGLNTPSRRIVTNMIGRTMKGAQLKMLGKLSDTVTLSLVEAR